MSFNKRIIKSNAVWSLLFGGVVFGVLFGWMLYYAATANEGTNVHPHLLGMPIFSVSSIDKGFLIGPEYGIMAVPLLVAGLVFVLGLVFRFAAGRLVRGLPQ